MAKWQQGTPIEEQPLWMQGTVIEDAAPTAVAEPPADGLVSGETYSNITPAERQRRIDAFNAGVDETGFWGAVQRIPANFKEGMDRGAGSILNLLTGGYMQNIVGYDAEAEGQPFLADLEQRRQESARRNKLAAGDSYAGEILGDAGSTVGEITGASIVAPLGAGIRTSAGLTGLKGAAARTAPSWPTIVGAYAPQYYQQAKEQGASETGAIATAATKSLVDVATSVVGGAVVGKLGGKTPEMILGRGATTTLSGRLLTPVVGAGEEVVAEYMQAFTDYISGLDPDAIKNVDALRVALVGGFIDAAYSVSDAAVSGTAKAFLDTRSRSAARKAGIPPEMANSKAKRDEIADAAQALAAQTQETTNAQQDPQASPLHGDVQYPEGPQVGQEVLPATESSQGVPQGGQEEVITQPAATEQAGITQEPATAPTTSVEATEQPVTPEPTVTPEAVPGQPQATGTDYDLPFHEMNRITDGLQEQIDKKHDELDAMGVPFEQHKDNQELAKLYQQRISLEEGWLANLKRRSIAAIRRLADVVVPLNPSRYGKSDPATWLPKYLSPTYKTGLGSEFKQRSADHVLSRFGIGNLYHFFAETKAFEDRAGTVKNLAEHLLREWGTQNGYDIDGIFNPNISGLSKDERADLVSWFADTANQMFDALVQEVQIGTTPSPRQLPQPQAAEPVAEATVQRTLIDVDGLDGGEPPAPELPSATDEPGTVGIKHASTAEVRERHGLPAYEREPATTQELQRQQAIDERVPERALDIAAEVIKTGRQLTDVETVGFTMKLVDLENAWDAAQAEIEKLGDKADSTHFALQDRIEGEIDLLTKASDTAGSDWGRIGRARQYLMDRYKSFVTVKSEAKLKKGEPLTEQDTAKLKTAHDKHTRAKKRLDAFEAKEKKKQHREVARIKAAISNIRQQIGLDPKKLSNVEVPGLTAEENATLDKLAARLTEAETKLAAMTELPVLDRVHNRPSEQIVSELDDAIATARSAIRALGKKPTPSSVVEARKIKALERALAKAQDDLAKVKAGERPTTPQRADVMSEQRAKLVDELRRTRQEVKDTIASMEEKTFWHHAQAWNDLYLALRTSVDMSGLLRQGKYIFWSHPILAAKHVKTAVSAARSDANFNRILRKLRSRPNGSEYERVGLAIQDSDTKVTEREDFVASELIKKVPLLRGSQRAYLALLNSIRADTYDIMKQTNGGSSLTKAEREQLAHFINVASGRGSIKALDANMRAYGTVLWAPRLILSRVQFAFGQPAWHATPRMRKAIGKEYLRMLVGAGAWYTMYAMMFGDDEDFSLTFDPRDPLFGKVNIGNTHVDPLAGLAQLTRLVGGRVAGQSIDKKGRVKDTTAWDKEQSLKNFLRSKLGPAPGLATSLWIGQDYSGESLDLTTPEGVWNLVTEFSPLSLNDIYDTAREQGIAKGTVISALALLGEGVQTYKKEEKPTGRRRPARPSR